MLVKTVDGRATRLIHKGVRYYFDLNEIKDCPESILAGYRGILVSAEKKEELPQPEIKTKPKKMPIINIDKTKIKVKTKKSKKQIFGGK